MNEFEPIFEPLPPARRGRQPAAFWAVLKEHPGEWARIPCGATSASAARKRHPDYEVVRRVVDGEKRVYGRYIGEHGEYTNGVQGAT